MQLACWGTMRDRVHLCYGMWTGGLLVFSLQKKIKEYILEVSVGRYVGTHAAVASRVEKKDPRGKNCWCTFLCSLFVLFWVFFLLTGPA